MKTTLELPDDLFVEIKVRAAHERRPMKDVVNDLLRTAIDARPDVTWPDNEVQVAFPLVLTGKASESAEVTPERAAEILGAQEAESATGGDGAR